MADAKRARKMTPKQQRFADEYLVDLDATAAAKRAGYSAKSAAQLGYQLLQIPSIQAYIAKGREKQQERTQITADVVLGELLRIARVDLSAAYNPDGSLKSVHDMPEDVRRAISSIEVVEEYDGYGRRRRKYGETRRVRFHDKIRSLELLGKKLGLFPNQVKLEASGDLAAALAAARQRAGKA